MLVRCRMSMATARAWFDRMLVSRDGDESTAHGRDTNKRMTSTNARSRTIQAQTMRNHISGLTYLPMKGGKQ